MSVIKNKETRYHPTPQDVKFKLSWIRINHLDNLSKLELRGGLKGTVGDTEGEVDFKEAAFSRQGLMDEFSAAEKTAAKAFVAACERVLAKQISELSEENHDDTDVFV